MSVKVRKYKRGGWEVDIRTRLADGTFIRERVRSWLESKSGALRWGQQREAFLIQNGVRPAEASEPKEVPTVGKFESQFMTFSKTNNKPSTVYAKEWILRTHLIPFFGQMKLDEFGPPDIEAYKAKKLDEKQGKKSINNHLAALRKLLNLAVEWGVIEKAPKVKAFRMKVELISDDEFLTFEETERFVRAAAPEWKPFVIVALKTGLRVGELLALKWQDIDLVVAQLVVRRTLWQGEEGPPKGGRNRTVPLSDVAVATLKAHRHLRGPYVFCNEKGERLTHSIVKDVVPTTCKKAGLAKRITTHGLRHTFASHLIMRGQSLKAVQELLGHESIEMTLRYSHLTPDVKRDAVQALDDAAPSPPERTASGQKPKSLETCLETEGGQKETP
jgi:integrase